jgi:hypothetical protein
LRRHFALIVLPFLFAAAFPAQTANPFPSAKSTELAGLPSAPGFELPAAQDQRHSASIFGTVTDPGGQVVPSALVELMDENGKIKEAIHSGPTGAFLFQNLSPGHYRVVATLPGMGKFTSPLIVLADGEPHIIPDVILPLARVATQVHVYASRDAIAEEEIHIAEQQRVFGVFPNFYSAYDWNALPLGPKQKFKLAIRSVIDPVAFAGYAAAAGVEQQQNSFSGYGSGPGGYGKRYGALAATASIARITGSALYPSIFHQDPRYFYKGSGSRKSRAFYAISESVMARGDNGRQQINYSRILGSLTAGAISNAYYPPGDRGVSLVFTNALIEIGGSAGENLIREFVLKRFTTRGKGDPAP